MGIIKDAIHAGSMKRKEFRKDDGGAISLILVGIIAAVSLVGTYYLTKPVGEGIGDMFTIFGSSISLYVVTGLVILGLVFLWLVFGRDD